MPEQHDSVTIRSVDDDHAVVSLTLNRPSVNNAYNGELIDALHAELDELESMDGIRVAILRGTGPHRPAWHGSSRS